MVNSSHGHKPRTPAQHRSRRWFMNKALLAGGVSAVAVMGGYAASQAGAETTSDATADATASATPSGPPPGGGGGFGQTIAYDDFVGVTTDGTVIDDLYAIHRTGVSTTPVVRAAAAFVDSLTDDQKSATLFDIDADQWLDWTNVDSNDRDGLALRDMTEKQYKLAIKLLKAALSARGLENATQIRKLNHFLGENSGDTTKALNYDAYWFTIMGTPSATDPWGFQFEGHHLVINYFVLGDQVVATPTFRGSEPTKITYDGVDYHLFREETAAGLKLLRSLDDTQLATAAPGTETKTGTNLTVGAGNDNAVLPYKGLRVSELNRKQQKLLLNLVEVYTGTIDEGHSRVWLRDIEKHLDDTYFYWIGESEDDSAFYYRVHSPVVLIEYDAESALAYHEDGDTSSGGPNGTPTQQHIHTIIRTPNGNDYGVDLLKLHLETDH
ncbi:DUF3500 domain-containing protein [Streptomyces justiciae]|uniref:DUF3500 domain-containing protein n=1 Tax=Streptomyces justiciae TaxID=2780140 RepID=A0ABU3M4F5_9ACTN|nr:DUF3500 domain-containing protein [Streptomyces justiciae]MDT7846362.1 DUF3500 domain-containing protein [Streptomyces justiciae]